LRNYPNSGRVTTIYDPVFSATGPSGGADVHAHSLIEYGEILWRRRFVVLAIALICTSAAYAVTKLMKPVYRSAISVVVENRPEIVPLGPEPPTDGAATEASFQTQVQLFQSKSLIKRVLIKLNGGTWLNARNAAKSPRERELEFVADSVKVIPAKGTRLINIQAEAHDPQLAAAFANTVVSEQIALEREDESKKDKSDSDWLESQVAVLKASIENSERTLFAFANGTDVGLTTNGEKGQDSRLTRLQDELSRAQVERFGAAARYELASKGTPKPESTLSESPTLHDYEAKLIELRRQLAEATALWTSDHPKVKQLEAQVNVLTTAIEAERGEVLSRIRGDYVSALRKEQLLSDEYLNVVKKVTDRETRGVHYSLLKRDLDRDRELYDAIVHKMKQVSITSGLHPTAIHLVDAAEPSLRPSRPNVTLTSYLALICSMFLGAVVVLVREHFGSTVESPGECSALLNVNELGAIPSQRAIERRGWPISLPIPGVTKAAVPNGAVELTMLRETGSITAQCFRGALASILFAADDLHSIVVTSAVEGEGKTTVVSNLGLVLARMGRRVLFIDADHQKPRLYKIFGITREVGLRELIEGSGAISLDSYVCETGIDGLHLLQSGLPIQASEPRAEFPEILLSQRIAELMHIAKREYDFVLIDTPPLSQFHDSRVWGRLADGVVFVVRAGETNRQLAMAAVSTLHKDGAVLLGTILNDLDPTRTRAYEYYPAAAQRRRS
jgi:capsular exopolysaccharide synthesis family protein